ncbi:uncharacterized protein TrAFT101_010553 [Trichoderma asperellum]|uniref:uncharacterized protein n=1 Tax=Trichoderma asperellum TaxID=101201 RepID=UPI00331D433B|nr:hypothetical protein TrAFT101_010553 [Trichoderma asperellum]
MESLDQLLANGTLLAAVTSRPKWAWKEIGAEAERLVTRRTSQDCLTQRIRRLGGGQSEPHASPHYGTGGNGPRCTAVACMQGLSSVELVRGSKEDELG